MLVKQRDALDETLKDAPLALNNLALTYNPQAGTLDTCSNTGSWATRSPATRRPSCAAGHPGRQSGELCDVIQHVLKDLPAVPRAAAFGEA